MDQLMIIAANPSDFEVFIEFLGDKIVWIMIIVLGACAIIGGTIKEIVRSRAKEQSRREIAAYIAEGSMTPEQGERLLKAGRLSCDA